MKVIAVLVELCIILGAISACLVVAAATVYDTLTIFYRRRFEAAKHILRYHRLSEVTYLIYITTSAGRLGESLRRIKQEYRRSDCVVVVDSTVPAAVKREVRQIVDGQSRCRLYIRRKPSSLPVVLAAAYRRSKHGEFIVYGESDQLPGPKTTHRALAWCRTMPRYGGIRFALASGHHVTVGTLASLLLQASHQLAGKALPLRWSSSISPGIYQRSAFRRFCQGKRIVTGYRSDVFFESTRHPRPSVLLLVLGSVAWLVALYSSIVAALLLSASPLIASWSIACAWLVAAIWFSSSRSVMSKIDLTICVPFGYFALFSNGIVTFARRCVRRTTF